MPRVTCYYTFTIPHITLRLVVDLVDSHGCGWLRLHSAVYPFGFALVGHDFTRCGYVYIAVIYVV